MKFGIAFLTVLVLSACGGDSTDTDTTALPLEMFCADLQSVRADLTALDESVSNSPAVAAEWAPVIRVEADLLRGQGQMSVDADVLANRLEQWQTLEPGTLGDAGYQEAFLEEYELFVTRYCSA